MEKLALVSGVELERSLPLNQDFQEESEKIEIFLRRRNEKGLILKPSDSRPTRT